MSYNKKNWKTGDYVTQKDINNIENGIYEAHKDIANMNEDIADINNDLGTAILNTTDKTLKGAINELFQFVSNGKELIARAITDKGVITSKTDTFQQMANNIRSITIDVNNFTFTKYKKLDNGVLVEDTDTSEATYYATVNMNEVTPGNNYTININLGTYICVCYYDKSNNYISYTEANTDDWTEKELSTTITIPSNARYIRVCTTNSGIQVTGTLTKIEGIDLLDSTGAYMVDDFIGSSVDGNKWGYELGYVRNGETQRYVNTNAIVNGGILALKGIKDSNGNWTSSSIISKGRFAFMYGKIEARIRFCNYNGSFGAFWSLGDSFEYGYKENDTPDVLGQWWAWCGEFDIVEFYNGNLTSGAFFNEKEESGRVYYNNYNTGDWHIFAMEWNTDGSLIFSIDGNELSRTSATDNRAFHIPHFILINQAIGASGGTPDSNTTEMIQYVDWVKYYPASTDNLVLNSSNFSLEVTDINDSAHNCMVRLVFNDNCINKSVTWSSSNTDVIICHSGLCSSKAGVNGTSTITATSRSGATANITLTVNDGVIRQS